MTADLTKERIIESWFYESEVDLRCAKLLYEDCFYSRCLYHLQQSNEKLAKGLLLSIGVLSAKKIQNQKIKSIIGFIPKEPHAYRHRTLPFFLTDMSSASPAMEKIINSIDWKGAEDIFQNFQITLKKSRKGIEKLKKKPFTLITSKQQLKNEIKAINIYLNKLDEIREKMKAAAANLDPEKAITVALKTTKKLGFVSTHEQAFETYEPATKRAISVTNLCFLVILSVSTASFLDPLEALTRYPDQNHGPFTKGDVYVECFGDLCEIIRKTLEKTVQAQKERTDKTQESSS